MAKRFPEFDSETFLNWLKLGVAIRYTKEGIEPLVVEDLKQFQEEVLKQVYTQKGVCRGTTCSSCCTENVVPCFTRDYCKKGKGGMCNLHSPPGKQHKACPNKICEMFFEKICSEHRFSKPSWKNSYAERWCTEPVELAKCFMPKDGYAHVTTFKEVDFNGVLNVIINNKRMGAKFSDDLTPADNIITEARDVGKAFRHSPDLAVDKATFQASVDILANMLSNVNCQAHQQTTEDQIATINQLKDEDVKICSSNTSEVIEDFLKTTDEHDASRKMQEAQVAFLRDVANAAKSIDQVTTESLQEIIRSVSSAKAEIETVARREKKAVMKQGENLKRKHKQSLTQHSKRMRTSFRREKEKAVADVKSSATSSRTSGTRISESEDYPKLKKELREDLIQSYRKQHNNLPVSPLREENKVPLLQLYVAPTLKCKEYEKGTFSKQKTEHVSSVTTYHDVFYKGAEECQDIYLASPSGTGKTSYVKRMALAWCFSHSPDQEGEKTYFTEDEVNTIKHFDFLFLIAMRESSRHACNIDDMITTQVISQLSRSYLYSDDLLQEILHNEKCLIIIDGLDEWTHPKNGCPKSASPIPHQKDRKKCTTLTTTRPWKVDLVIGGNYFIDQHIEMSGLEEPSVKELIDNALEYLNKEFNDEKRPEDFINLLKENRVHKLKSIPLLLLQLLCLWFKKGQLGNSRCEIYSNMIEFLFGRAKKRMSYPATRSKTKNKNSTSLGLPNCFSNCSLCHAHTDLILALGELAFDGLFGIRPDSSLLFNETVIEKYLDTNMLKLCKETGILSQNDVCRKLIHTESKYSFIHKSYQEFLAALYISLQWSPRVSKKMFSFCASRENILQVSNIFIFVSGMMQEVAGDLLRECSEIVSQDENTLSYRRNIGTLFIKCRRSMYRLHTVMINCLQESYDNGLGKLNVIAQDVFISSKCKLNWLLEKGLIDRNMNNIRSLDIQTDTIEDQVHEMLHSLDVQSLNTLEKLYIWGQLPTQDIATVIQSSFRSLACLELWHLTFTDDLLIAIKKLDHLECLSLLSVSLLHNQILSLITFLKESQRMRQLSLNEVKCLDHGQYCDGFTLSLPHNTLEMLLLDKLHVTKIDVDSQRLTMCVVEWLHKSGSLTSLLHALDRAPKLERFDCDGAENCEDLDKLVSVLTTFTSMKYLKLRNINLKDRNLMLSGCESLECIYMWRVHLNSHSLEQLLMKIKTLPRVVTVQLEGCEIKPATDYERLKQQIQCSEQFEVERDTSDGKKYPEFYFKTVWKDE